MKKESNEREKVKEIGWAYPTSTEAVRLGYGKTGCFVLSVGDWMHPKAISASSCFEELEAIAEAKKEYKWSFFTWRPVKTEQTKGY